MINLCKFGQNPSIHLGDIVQTRGYADADANLDADGIRTKKQYVPTYGGGHNNTSASYLHCFLIMPHTWIVFSCCLILKLNI